MVIIKKKQIIIKIDRELGHRYNNINEFINIVNKDLDELSEVVKTYKEVADKIIKS